MAVAVFDAFVDVLVAFTGAGTRGTWFALGRPVGNCATADDNRW